MDGCDTGGWTEVTASGTSKKILGLSIDTIYRVRVAATNAAGDNDWSDQKRAQTADVPGVPTGLSHPISGTNLLASWTAPDDDGGDAGHASGRRSTLTVC